MNPLDILSALPPFRGWSPAEVLASPAWAMPCRLGSEEGRLVSEGALLPADPLRLAVRFADDPATLALADSPIFPELHALWASRAEVPAPLLLALVEKECGPLLQLLENAAGRQLAIDGLADVATGGAGDSSPGRLLPFSLLRASGEPLCSFALTLPPAVLESFGALRNLDAAHPSIRELELPAVVQLAAPVLSSADLASLAPGDHLLLPEVVPPPADSPDGQAPTCPDATLIVFGLLAAAPAGLAPWTDPGTLRVVLADPATLPLGDLLDLASGALDHSSLVTRHSSLREGVPLALLRGPATLATGRLGAVAAQPSFEIETVTPQP
jgi:hypothetical protein